MATWATTDDVELYTGLEAEESDVVRAEADITLFIGMTPEGFRDDWASDNDIYYLKLATCWQATRYINDEDDTFSFDVTATSQDGWSANLTNSGIVLHPKAKWAIRQLSWTKAKVVGGNRYGYGDYFNNVCAGSPIGWKRFK